MEKINDPAPASKADEKYYGHHHPMLSRITGGLFLVIAGALFLARAMGANLPPWLFTWPVLVVAIGIYTGIVNRFRSFFWVIPVLIGLAFLANQLYPGRNLGHYAWPVAMIVIGLAFILRPKRDAAYYQRRYGRYAKRPRAFQRLDDGDAPYSHEDFIEAVAIFGQIKKTPISKKFRGGDIVAVFGGVKVNLSQADIEEEAEFDLSAVFGGIQLVVPPHWKIKTEAEAIFGGIDDKREVRQDFHTQENKTLVLKGSVVFGGIEIKSF